MYFESSLFLANQRIADLHREAEANRLGARTRSGAGQPSTRLAALRRTMAVLSRQARWA